MARPGVMARGGREDGFELYLEVNRWISGSGGGVRAENALRVCGQSSRMDCGALD